MEELTAVTLDGLLYSSWLFIVAVGLTLIYGVMKILNIAHGSLYALGAYTAAWGDRGIFCPRLRSGRCLRGFDRGGGGDRRCVWNRNGAGRAEVAAGRGRDPDHHRDLRGVFNIGGFDEGGLGGGKLLCFSAVSIFGICGNFSGCFIRCMICA